MKSIFLQPGYDPGVGIPGFDGNEEILAVPEIEMWAAVSIWKGVHVNLISYIRCAFRIIHLSTAMYLCFRLFDFTYRLSNEEDEVMHKRKLEEQACNNKYHHLVEGNLIVKQGLLWKRKVISDM